MELIDVGACVEKEGFSHFGKIVNEEKLGVWTSRKVRGALCRSRRS